MSDAQPHDSTADPQAELSKSSDYEYEDRINELVQARPHVRLHRLDGSYVLDVLFARWPGVSAPATVVDNVFTIDDKISLLHACGRALRPSDLSQPDLDCAQIRLEAACDNWRHQYGGRSTSKPSDAQGSEIVRRTEWVPAGKPCITYDPSDKADYTRVDVARGHGSRTFALFLPFTESTISVEEELLLCPEWDHDCKPTVSARDFQLDVDAPRDLTTIVARPRLRFCDHPDNDRSAREPPVHLKSLLIERYRDIARAYFGAKAPEFSNLSPEEMRERVESCYQAMVLGGNEVLTEQVESGQLWAEIQAGLGETGVRQSKAPSSGQASTGSPTFSCSRFIELDPALRTTYRIVSFSGTQQESEADTTNTADHGGTSGPVGPSAISHRLRSSTGEIRSRREGSGQVAVPPGTPAGRGRVRPLRRRLRAKRTVKNEQ